MTFNELVEAVYAITAREDLVALTKTAVQTATIKAHTSDFYAKDIYETGVTFTDATNFQTMDMYSLIPNFRAISYFRRVSDQYDKTGVPFEIISPEELLDGYNQTRTDVAYVAGRVLETRSAVAYTYAIFGCYVLPLVTESNYSSWVAMVCPQAIIYEAARVIFKAISYDEESATFGRLVAEEYAILKMTGLANVGS